MIVIHGGPGLSKDYLLPALHRLEEFTQVVFYDQKGETLQALIEEIETLRKNTKQEKVILLGHSWGAYLAMQYAIAHPERVEKMILVNPIPATYEGYKEFNEEKGRRIQEKLDPESEEYLYRLFRYYFYDPNDVNKVNFHHRSNVELYERLSNDLLRHPYDLRPTLQKLHIPTLIIHGDADPIPVWAAKEIPHTQFVLIKQCGHFPYVEKPAIFFDTIRSFL